jgi:hypothetical protein
LPPLLEAPPAPPTREFVVPAEIVNRCRAKLFSTDDP